jgi:peroxin-1
MPRHATIQLVPLRSSLVNLPISVYGPLLERSVRPQSLGVHLTNTSRPSTPVYVGWTGLASASSLARFSTHHGNSASMETIEIDPQYAPALGFSQGDVVEIGLIYDLPIAKTVSTEPIGPDDWEVIVSPTDFISP